MKKYADILVELQQKIAFCMGENVGISFPLPDEINGVRVEKVFLYRKTLGLVRNRPFALLTVAMEDGRPLFY